MPQKNALEGITVCDFSWVGAGPLATKYLADFGAQVIKIESTKHPDIGRLSAPFKDNIIHPDRSAFFLHSNTSKLSITLNIRHPKGVEIVKKLVKISDIVMESFTPGVIAKLGFGYDELKKIKPDIIMASSSIYGQTGPKAQFSGFGNAGASLSGHYMLAGWPDRDPVTPGIAYADVVQPLFTVTALLNALDYRDKTGKGQYIDTTQVETMIQFIAPAVLDYFANGHVQTRIGNRSSYAAPHGVFPCKGEDRWCALAVFDEEEWQGLCRAMKNPAWASESRFATLASRKENEDELEKLIAQWTATYEHDALVTILQDAEVPSGPVQDASDLVDRDPQLRERQSFVKLTHPVIGECNHPVPPVRLSKTPAQVKTSPCVGEHNAYVYTQLLGISDEEYVELLNEGIFE
ncbi:MAG: CoA transferase [Deltaproteobacteria bacterium]|nr:CoA transferase [Deltaproteobacteria bacterium]